MRGDAGEHVAQPGERVDAVQLAGLDQTIDGGGTLSAGIRTGEEPIFPAEGDAADGVFGAVVVDLEPAVVDEAGERRPVAERVAERLGQSALRRQAAELRREPPVQCSQQRLGPFLPDLPPEVGRPAADRHLDPVELGDLFQGVGGDRRLGALVYLKDLAPGVRPTRHLDNPLAEEFVEPGIGVRLEKAAESSQMICRSFAPAVGRVEEHRRRRARIAARPVVADVDPQPAGLGTAAAGIEHRHRGVVSVHLRAFEDVRGEPFGQVPSRKWLEFGGGVISGLFNQPGRRFGAGGDHAMTTDSNDNDSMRVEDEAKLFLGDAWSDPIEAGIRDRIRGFIEELIEEELAAALGRGRYERRLRRGDGEAGPADVSPLAEAADVSPLAEAADVSPLAGHRHGHRQRRITGSFGTVEIVVPRARVGTANGGTAEWKSRTLPRYARMTKQVEALIAGAYLAGTNTRRVRRALAALFRGAVGKDTVSRVWRKVKTDWEAWSKRPLGEEDIVRLILDGTVVRARLDKKATSLSLLVVLGVRRDGQKVLLAVKNMGGESEAAWRVLLDDLVARGLKTPEFLIIDGAAGLEKALAALWPEVPTQRCTVHKHRNLLAHGPDHLHEEVSADY